MFHLIKTKKQMEQVSKDIFFERIQTFEHVPFTQSEGWYKMHVQPDDDRFVFFIDSTEENTIACMGRITQYFKITYIKIEGECWAKRNKILEKQITNFYKELSHQYDIVESNSTTTYSPNFEIAIRKAGYKRPLGSFSTPLTIQTSIENRHYSSDWKRNIRKAHESQLTADAMHDWDDGIVYRFTEMYNKMAEFKGFGHHVTFYQIKKLLSDQHFQLFSVKNNENKIIAFRIVFIFKDFITDVYAANDISDRKISVNHFLIDYILNYSQNQGVETFDFARIAPGNTANSVYQFKEGIRGSFVQYNGEWLFCQKYLYRPILYCIKRFLRHRVEF